MIINYLNEEYIFNGKEEEEGLKKLRVVTWSAFLVLFVILLSYFAILSSYYHISNIIIDI